MTPGQRASMNGEVPETVDYEQWLPDQSVEVQNKALGPVRAQLWRDGKLSLADMVDTDYQLINLKDLGFDLSGKAAV